MQKEKIKEIMNMVLEQNGIYPEEDLMENIDMDSLTFISIVVGLEEELGINIPADLLNSRPENYKEFYELGYNILEYAKGA